VAYRHGAVIIFKIKFNLQEELFDVVSLSADSKVWFVCSWLFCASRIKWKSWWNSFWWRTAAWMAAHPTSTSSVICIKKFAIYWTKMKPGIGEFVEIDGSWAGSRNSFLFIPRMQKYWRMSTAEYIRPGEARLNLRRQNLDPVTCTRRTKTPVN